ncbi:MAG: hypothetical protein ABIJ04_09670 [Bacteroidota bacterium]
MRQKIPFFFRQRFLPYRLGFGTDQEVITEPFQLFTPACVEQFVVSPAGGGDHFHGEVVKRK